MPKTKNRLRRKLAGSKFEMRFKKILKIAKKELKGLEPNGFQHSNTIEKYIERIIPNKLLLGNNKDSLSNAEIFILLCAIYFHDIGRKNGIPNHPRKSMEIIKEHYKELGFIDIYEGNDVGLVSWGHGEDCDITKMDNKHQNEKLGILDLQFLTCLLRLADDIDNAYTRVEKISGQRESIRHLIEGVKIDISGSRIVFNSCPKTSDEWEKLHEMGKYTQDRLDEIRPIFRLKGIEIDLILITPRDNPFKDKPTFETRKTSPIKESNKFREITNSNELYEITTNKYHFLENSFENDEFKIKKKSLFYFEKSKTEKKIKKFLNKLKPQQILLITGAPKIGKSTLLLFFLDQCLKRKLGDWKTIFFIDPVLTIEELEDVFNQINNELKIKQFNPNEVLLAIDGLKRTEESNENYISKCDKLFQQVSTQGYILIATLRDDQSNLLNIDFEDKIKWGINKWIVYHIDEEKIESHNDFKDIKMVLIKYLNFYKEKIKCDLSIDSPEFDECILILKKKWNGVIGDIAFLIDDIKISNHEFSKKTIQKYPVGSLNLRWNTIERDYFIKGDEVLPSLLFFLTNQEYSVTKEFIDEFVRWGIEKNDIKLIDKQEVLSRVENLVDFYFNYIYFENIQEYRLKEDWREAIKKGLLGECSKKYNKLINIFKKINLDDLICDFIFSEKVRLPPTLTTSKDIRVVTDIAKIWGVEGIETKIKLDLLKFSTNFFDKISWTHEMNTSTKFLKETLSLLWNRALNYISIEDCDFAIQFYKEVIRSDPKYYWAYRMLAEYYSRKNEEYEALDWHIKAVNIENRSEGYGSLIYRIKNYCKKNKLSDEIELMYIEIRNNIALKAIECYAGDSRNWYALGKVKEEKGKILLKQKNYVRAIKNFDDAIKVYTRGIEICEKLSLSKEDKIWYKKQIAGVIRDRAFAFAQSGRLEESIKDIECIIKLKEIKEIVEWLGVDIDEDEKWKNRYNYWLDRRNRIGAIFTSFCNITMAAIEGEKREILSTIWYNIYLLLNNVDMWWDGDEITNLKISALCQSINIDENNLISRKSLKSLKFFLFNIMDFRFKEEFLNNTISDDLRQIFARNRYTLSDNVKISSFGNNKWKIVDDERRYLIRESDNKLNVYSNFTDDDIDNRKKEYGSEYLIGCIRSSTDKFLFSFQDIINNKFQQMKLLKLISDPRSDIGNVIFSLEGNNRIKITVNNKEIASLEIEKNTCYLNFKEMEMEKIELGEAKKEGNEGNNFNVYKRDFILELFYRFFSNSINTIKSIRKIYQGYGDPEYARLEIENLSRIWGGLGRRITRQSEDFNFISRIPRNIAIQSFELSVKLNSNNFVSWHNLGWEYFYEGIYDKAMVAFQKNLDLEKDIDEIFLFSIIGLRYKTDLLNNVISVDLKKMFARNGITLSDNAKISSIDNKEWKIVDSKVEYTVKEFCNRLITFKKSKYGHLSKIGIGMIYEANENYQLAFEWFKSGIRLYLKFCNENNSEIIVDSLLKTANRLKRIGFIISDENKMEILNDALAFYEKALEISQNKNLTNTQLIREIIKFFKDQIEWIQKKLICPMMSFNKILEMSLMELLSIESKPESLDTLYKKERDFSKLGDHKKSIVYCDRIIGLNPNNVSVWINKSQSLGNLREYEKALDCTKKALDLDDKNGYAWHNRGLYLLKLANDKKTVNEAIKYFDISLKLLNYKYAPAWYNKAGALSKLEKNIESIECYNQALLLEPQNLVTFNLRRAALNKLTNKDT